MKSFFKKYKTEMLFWGITALLSGGLLVGFFFSFEFLTGEINKVSSERLIKTPEVVKFNLEKLDELLKIKQLKQQ